MSYSGATPPSGDDGGGGVTLTLISISGSVSILAPAMTRGSELLYVSQKVEDMALATAPAAARAARAAVGAAEARSLPGWLMAVDVDVDVDVDDDVDVDVDVDANANAAVRVSARLADATASDGWRTVAVVAQRSISGFGFDSCVCMKGVQESGIATSQLKIVANMRLKINNTPEYARSILEGSSYKIKEFLCIL